METQMFAEEEVDVYNSVCVRVDFVLNYCGFIFFFPSYLYSDDLEFLLFGVCMSLPASCESLKGQ